MFINYQTERYLVAHLNLSTASFAYFENVDHYTCGYAVCRSQILILHLLAISALKDKFYLFISTKIINVTIIEK